VETAPAKSIIVVRREIFIEPKGKRVESILESPHQHEAEQTTGHE
jgi:hypothetical protein